MVKCLELFCGTKSFKKACPNDWEVVSVDILEKFNPDICCDILDLDYKTLWKVGEFDIIWLSPPCRFFSQARNSSLGKVVKFHNKVLTKELMREDELKYGLPPVHRGLEIVDYLKPKYWFMENPVGRLKNYITDRHFIRVDYCMFGFDYKKPTMIWTNRTDIKDVKCDCKKQGKKHLPWDKVNGITTRYRMPPKLFDYLLDDCIF